MKWLPRLIAGMLLLACQALPARAVQSSGCMPVTGTYTGVAFSNLISAAIASVISTNSGPSAPLNDCSGLTVTGQLWYDTSSATPGFRIWDGAQGLLMGRVDPTNHIWMPQVGGGIATLASASTTDLCSVPQNYLNISGATAITSFGSSCTVGQIKFISFAGALTLTYGSSSIVLPPGASVTTAAGDQAVAVYTGSGVWQVVSYTRAVNAAMLAFQAATTPAGAYAALSGAIPMPQGRLTLTSGTPVMTSTVSASGTVYFTPYEGNQVPIWNGATYIPTACAEITNILANSATGNAGPAAAAASSNYDLFIWNVSGSCVLTRGAPWTNSTAIATRVTRINGILTNTSAITNGPGPGYGTFVGSVTTDSSGATVTWAPVAAGSGGNAASLNVWNMYHRVPVSSRVTDTGSSYTYGSSTFRESHGSLSNQINFLVGLPEDGYTVSLLANCAVAGGGTYCQVGYGLDSASAVTAGYVQSQQSGISGGGVPTGAGSAIGYSASGYAGVGQHALIALEAGTATFNSASNNFISAALRM